MLALEVLNLSYRAQSGGVRFLQPRSREILSNISLRLEGGQCLGIIGESGSGKTTLAKCIAGLVLPTSGSINLFGVNVYPETRGRDLVRRRVQHMFQNYTSSLDPLISIERSLYEALDPGHLSAAGELRKQAREFLRVVQLPPDMDSRFPRDLSGGQRQRVAIARALAADPELLILDEPASALDVLTRTQILRLIKEIQRGRNLTLIYISHDISTTAALCDRVAVVHRGWIVEEGVIEDVLAHPQNSYTEQLLRLSGVTTEITDR